MLHTSISDLQSKRDVNILNNQSKKVIWFKNINAMYCFNGDRKNTNSKINFKLTLICILPPKNNFIFGKIRTEAR